MGRSDNTQAGPPFFFYRTGGFFLVLCFPDLPLAMVMRRRRRTKAMLGPRHGAHTCIRLPVPIAREGWGKERRLLERPWCGFCVLVRRNCFDLSATNEEAWKPSKIAGPLLTQPRPRKENRIVHVVSKSHAHVKSLGRQGERVVMSVAEMLKKARVVDFSPTQDRRRATGQPHVRPVDFWSVAKGVNTWGILKRDCFVLLGT